MTIGSPDALTAASTKRAVSDWSFLVEAITGAAASGGAAAVPGALAKFHGDDRIITPLAESGALANLAGQMHVRLVEMHGRAHLLDDRPPFLSMSFEEAREYWIERNGDPTLIDQILASYRQQAGASSDILLDTISQRAVDAIQRTLDDGGTLQDFIEAVRSDDTDLVNLGITPASSSYLDLVFRTNVGTAYGAGRWVQLNDPDVIAARPYRQGRTAEDERVRPEHAPIDGVVWLATDPAFAMVAAPFGFRCRCLVVSGDREDFIAWGGVLSDALPAGFQITPGFGAAAFTGTA